MKLTDEVLRQISTDTGWSFYTVREIVSAIPERPAPAPEPTNPIAGTSAFPSAGLRDRDFDVPQAAPAPEPQPAPGFNQAALTAAQLQQPQPAQEPVTKFEGWAVKVDPSMPKDEVRIESSEKPLGRITNIGPAPPVEDDAAVVEEMWKAYSQGWRLNHTEVINAIPRMADALAVARRGYVPASRLEGMVSIEDAFGPLIKEEIALLYRGGTSYEEDTAELFTQRRARITAKPQMASELKACPFCGQPPKTRRNRNDGLYIFCSFDGCDAQLAIEAFGPEKDEEIVDSWNRRVPDEALVRALKDLRWASLVQPSCQKGAIDVCRCLVCASLRADAALRSAGVEP